MRIHIEIGSVKVAGNIEATWPARLIGWLIFIALGIFAVHLLAATDIPDTRPTTTILGAMQ